MALTDVEFNWVLPAAVLLCGTLLAVVLLARGRRADTKGQPEDSWERLEERLTTLTRENKKLRTELAASASAEGDAGDVELRSPMRPWRRRHPVLAGLLEYGPPHADDDDLEPADCIVVPRFGTISPWASKATDIAHACAALLDSSVEWGAAARVHERAVHLRGAHDPYGAAHALYDLGQAQWRLRLHERARASVSEAHRRCVKVRFSTVIPAQSVRAFARTQSSRRRTTSGRITRPYSDCL
jgi:hypothetical protein